SRPPSERPKATAPNETSKQSSTSSPATSSPTHPLETATSPIFVRLVDPSLHREAITSRPLFLSAIATRTRHARQTTIRVTSSHAKAKPAATALAAAAVFLRGLAKSAEQLTRLQKWRAILSRAFQAFLNGRLLRGAALARANLMQPERAKSRNPAASRPSTAVFRINVVGSGANIAPEANEERFNVQQQSWRFA